MNTPSPICSNVACRDFSITNAHKTFHTEECFWGIGGHFQYVECPQCKSWVLYPSPTDEELNRHYEGYYPPEEYAQRTQQPISVVEKERARQTYQVLKGFRRFTSSDRVLDVGTGCGGFLAAFREHVDVQALGCDQNTKSAQFAKSLFDIDVDVGEFSTLNYPAHGLSLITLWHCFEHVRCPDQTLAELNHHLTDDGILVIEVPTPGLWARTFKGAWLFLQAPTHLNLFTPSALVEMLEQAKFEVLKSERPWSPTEWAGSVLIKLGLRGFMPRIYFGPKRFSDRLWRGLFFLLMPLDLCFTLFAAVMGQSGLLRVYARPQRD